MPSSSNCSGFFGSIGGASSTCVGSDRSEHLGCHIETAEIEVDRVPEGSWNFLASDWEKTGNNTVDGDEKLRMFNRLDAPQHALSLSD